MQTPGPIALKPIFLTKVWAAQTLAGPWGEIWDAPEQTGEVWLASDRLHITKAADGPYQDMGLDEIMAQCGDWIVGRSYKPGDGFPLLLKILSVGDWLSVQVHPDDDEARRLESEPWGKSEAWHMLAADADAAIVMGMNQGADIDAIKAAVSQGNLVDLLAKVPVGGGQTFHLPAGTVHAAGPGMTFFEIQQASDVTYRFYDWNRPGDDGKLRDLHIDKALEVVKAAGPGRPTPPMSLGTGMSQASLLVEDRHFGLIKVEASAPYSPDFRGKRLRVILVTRGEGVIESAGGEFAAAPITPGQCWLLGAGLPNCEIKPTSGGLSFLESVAF